MKRDHIEELELGGDEERPPISDAAALEALERFVVDNDDLIELETRIGRFNIFDALGIVRAEIRHSNYLAWVIEASDRSPAAAQ